MINRAIDMRFVCTLPATIRCTHLSLNPVLHHVCVPTLPTPLTTARGLLQAPVSTVTSDRVITVGGKHSWALDFLSILLWTCCI